MNALYDLLQQHPSYAYLAPVLLVLAAAMIMFTIDLVSGARPVNILVGLLGAAALAVAAFLSWKPAHVDIVLVSSLVKTLFAQDLYARYFNVLFCAAGILVILISFSYKEFVKYVGEFFALIVVCTAAFMFLAGATNLIMIYLCIEFVGITCYVLAAYAKNDARSGEGALKYLLVGGTASAFMLYGMSLLYGFTGSLDIKEIGAAIGAGVPKQAAYVALIMVLAGFGFKVAMVPFHSWAPDAYEGAPTPITAFFSVAPKAAGVAVLFRAFLAMFPNTAVNWVPILTVLSCITMTTGNIIAIWQTNVKRMLAYSSIAHVGYILIGLVVAGLAKPGTEEWTRGVSSAMIYVTTYILMNLGAFTAIIIASNTLGTDDLKHYNGLGRRAPFTAACLTYFLLSLAGIPPTAGFTGKLFLFMGAIHSGVYVLAFFLAANAIVSVYYYWALVRRMFIEEPLENTPVRASAPLALVMTATAIAVLILGIFFQTLMQLAQKAILSS